MRLTSSPSSEPPPATLSMGEALSRHYADHGLPPDGGEHERWFRIRVGPLVIPLPNPPVRQRAVFAHDANHVLTGYNTVFGDGEMVIAGFELGSGGCASFGFAWLINFIMFALGLVCCPRPMFAAFVRGRRASNMYQRGEGRAALSAMTVREVQALISLDVAAPATTWVDRALFAGLAVATAGGMILGAVGLVVVLRNIGVASLRAG